MAGAGSLRRGRGRAARAGDPAQGQGSTQYVGVERDAHLIRPALYGAWHGIENLSRLCDSSARRVEAEVVGPICETGDVLGHDRLLREPREGDVLAVATAGAYGAAMSSDYNLRGRPREVLV